MNRGISAAKIALLFALVLAVAVGPMLLTRYEDGRLFSRSASYPVQLAASDGPAQGEDAQDWDEENILARLLLVRDAVTMQSSLEDAQIDLLVSDGEGSEIFFAVMDQLERLYQDGLTPLQPFRDQPVSASCSRKTYFAREDPRRTAAVWEVLLYYPSYSIHLFMDARLRMVYDLIVVTSQPVSWEWSEATLLECFTRYIGERSAGGWVWEDESFRVDGGYDGKALHLCLISWNTQTGESWTYCSHRAVSTDAGSGTTIYVEAGQTDQVIAVTKPPEK